MLRKIICGSFCDSTRGIVEHVNYRLLRCHSHFLSPPFTGLSFPAIRWLGLPLTLDRTFSFIFGILDHLDNKTVFFYRISDYTCNPLKNSKQIGIFFEFFYRLKQASSLLTINAERMSRISSHQPL